MVGRSADGTNSLYLFFLYSPLQFPFFPLLWNYFCQSFAPLVPTAGATYLFSSSLPLRFGHYSPDSHYFYGPGFPAESQAVLLSAFRRLFSSARVPVDRLHLPILLPGSAHSFFFSLIHFSRWPLPSSGYKYSPCVDNSHADISTIDFSPELGYLIDFSKLSRPERNLFFSCQKTWPSDLPYFCKSKMWTYVNLLKLKA